MTSGALISQAEGCAVIKPLADIFKIKMQLASRDEKCSTWRNTHSSCRVVLQSVCEAAAGRGHSRGRKYYTGLKMKTTQQILRQKKRQIVTGELQLALIEMNSGVMGKKDALF